MEKFFVAEGLPHLMFYHQEVETTEEGERTVCMCHNTAKIHCNVKDTETLRILKALMNKMYTD